MAGHVSGRAGGWPDWQPPCHAPHTGWHATHAASRAVWLPTWPWPPGCRFNTRLKGINGGVLLLRPCPAVQQHMIELLDSHPKLRFSYGAAEQDFFNWWAPLPALVDGALCTGGSAALPCHCARQAACAAPPCPPLRHRWHSWQTWVLCGTISRLRQTRSSLSPAAWRSSSAAACPPPWLLCHCRYYRYTGMMLPLEYNTMASDSLHASGNLTIGGHAPVVVHFTQTKPFRGAQPGTPGHQLLCSAAQLD